ncbi:hypothetical protein EJ08DRAFT_737875 [Tothia fuscella]|uniref:Uncharacterized protein n=1 Tax=Tothia fuscella TaxID=1048955 RepID=A0A9P4NIH7_9PEZI|nr:hypothetical protein EJ08DRAFT_737875 [Tothia fuscella]
MRLRVNVVALWLTVLCYSRPLAAVSPLRPTLMDARPTATPHPFWSSTSYGDPASCRSSWVSYVKRDLELGLSSKVFDEHNSVITTATKTVDTSLESNLVVVGQGPLTTLCDGFPRARFSTSFVNITSHLQSELPTFNNLKPPPRIKDEARPNCSISGTDCKEQWARFVASFPQMMPNGSCTEACTLLEFLFGTGDDAYATNPSFFGGCSGLRSVCLKNLQEYKWLESDLTPNNGTTKTRATDSWLPCAGNPTLESCGQMLGQCQMDIGRFVLIYFPEEVVERDICANEGFGAARFRNQSRSGVVMTAEVENITFGMYQLNKGPSDNVIVPSSIMTGPFIFTSPFAYLAYDTISAKGSCFPPRGTYTNGILTLHRSEISSMVVNRACSMGECTTADFFTSRPFNFADMEGHVPASAYFDGPRLLTDGSTIVDGAYFAFLAVPTQVRDLDPEFSNCAPFSKHSSLSQLCHAGFWDPPVLLKPTPAIRVPNLSNHFDATITPFPDPLDVQVANTNTVYPQATAAMLHSARMTSVQNSEQTPHNRLEGDSSSNENGWQPPSATESGGNGVPDLRNKHQIVFQFNGKLIRGHYFQDTNGDIVLRIKDHKLVAGGPPVMIDSKSLRLDSNGSIIEDSTPVNTLSGTLWTTKNALVSGQDLNLEPVTGIGPKNHVSKERSMMSGEGSGTSVGESKAKQSDAEQKCGQISYMAIVGGLVLSYVGW